jgi:hypothetical protein
MKYPIQLSLTNKNFFKQNGEQKTIQFLSGGLVSVGGGKDMGRGCRRVNMVEILCTHVCKWKKRDLLKLFQEWGKGDKGE